MRFEVYAHASPSGKVYVGWTSRGMVARWAGHMRAARREDTAFYRAIRKYGAASFTHELLERMSTEAGAKRAEQLWIARLKTRAPAGYNLTDGGDGVSGVQSFLGRKHTPEARAKISAAHVGQKHSAETLAKLRASHIGKTPSIETRAKMSAAQIGRKHPERSDETRAKLRAARARQAPISETTRVKMSVSHTGRKHTVEARAKVRAFRLGKTHSAETRAKIGVAGLGRKHSEETRAKMRVAHAKRRAREKAGT